MEQGASVAATCLWQLHQACPCIQDTKVSWNICKTCDLWKKPVCSECLKVTSGVREWQRHWQDETPLGDTAVGKQVFPLHYVHGCFWLFTTKNSCYDSVSCRCLTPSQHTPHYHTRCCSFKARHPGSSKSYQGLSWTAQVTKCMTMKNQQKEKRLRFRKQLSHLKVVWHSQRRKKGGKRYSPHQGSRERFVLLPLVVLLHWYVADVNSPLFKVNFLELQVANPAE